MARYVAVRWDDNTMTAVETNKLFIDGGNVTIRAEVSYQVRYSVAPH